MVDNKKCRTCVYFGGSFDECCTCNYIFVHGTRRPCPLGSACTVKKPRKKVRKMKIDRMKERSDAVE